MALTLGDKVAIEQYAYDHPKGVTAGEVVAGLRNKGFLSSGATAAEVRDHLYGCTVQEGGVWVF